MVAYPSFNTFSKSLSISKAYTSYAKTYVYQPYLGQVGAQYGYKYNIRCVCVSPGPVLTRPGMAWMKTLADKDGRAGQPQEIIDLCLFIASEKGQFINGENIMIDGGRNAMVRENKV